MSDEINELNTKLDGLRNEIRHIKRSAIPRSFPSYQMAPEIQTLKAEIDSLKLNRNEANNKEQGMKGNDNCCEEVKQILDKLVKEKEEEKKEQGKKETDNNINDLKTKVDILLKEKEEEKKKQELKEKDKCCEEIKATLDQLLKEKKDKESDKEKEIAKKENDKCCEEIKKLLENLIKEKTELNKENGKKEDNTCLEEVKTLKEEVNKLKQIHQDLEMVISENKKKEEEKAKQVCMHELKKLKEEIERVSKPKEKDKESSCQEEVNKLKEEIDRLKNLVGDENTQKEKNDKDKPVNNFQDELYKEISQQLRDKCSQMYKEELAKITGNKDKSENGNKGDQTFQKLVLDLLTKLVKDDMGDENGKGKEGDPESKTVQDLKNKLDKITKELERIKPPIVDVSTTCKPILDKLKKKTDEYRDKEQENSNLLGGLTDLKNKVNALEIDSFNEEKKASLLNELQKIIKEKDKKSGNEDNSSGNNP